MNRLIAKLVDMFIVLLLTLILHPFGFLLGLIYISLADGLNDGQSVGKKIMGFAVLSLEDGTPCSVKQSFIRNLPLSIPLIFSIIPLWGWVLAAFLSLGLTVLEVYLLFKLDSGHRLGDVMADTTVIANDNQMKAGKNKSSGWFDNGKPIAM